MSAGTKLSSPFAFLTLTPSAPTSASVVDVRHVMPSSSTHDAWRHLNEGLTSPAIRLAGSITVTSAPWCLRSASASVSPILPPPTTTTRCPALTRPCATSSASSIRSAPLTCAWRPRSIDAPAAITQTSYWCSTLRMNFACTSVLSRTSMPSFFATAS